MGGLRRAVRPAINRASRLVDRVAPPPVGVTVLIYHRVGGGSDSAVDLDEDVFERQLAHLVAHHRVLSLGDALSELRGGPPAPEGTGPAVVVTFDDGTADFVDQVVPALVRHRVPATLYAATRFIDEQEAFPWGAPPASWAGLREAVSTGLVSIGSHTHSHFLLHHLAPVDAVADLDRSIELIGEQVGVAPDDFAYPKAVPASPVNEVAVRQRFRSAALARSRVNRPGRADPHRLWRTPVQRSDDDGLFAVKAAGGMRLDGELRALLARRRYQSETR